MSLTYADPFSFLNPKLTFAVVEASNDSTRLGFRIYALLKQAGFSVMAVNPLETTVQGDPCFPNLAQVHPFPDAVFFAIPYGENPLAGTNILQEMRNLGIFRVWIERGCETQAMKRFAQEHNMEILTGFSLENEIQNLPPIPREKDEGTTPT